MMEISITIPGDPKSQQRHRSFQKGNFRGTYDPSEKQKKDFLSLCYEKKPRSPIDEPIRMSIKLFYQRPKSHYGTGKNSKVLKPGTSSYNSSRPDIDNCVKFIFDALNTVFYRDDSQICILEVAKLYSSNPRTEILIQTL